jgi:hypothetical protein
MHIAYVVVTVLAAAMSGFSAFALLSRADWVVQAMVEYEVPEGWWTWLGAATAGAR